MKLISKASSSSGNSHILVGDNEALMLDCGVPNISYVANYNLVGVLLSHSHNDHISGLKRKNYLGLVNVYGNQRTLDNCPYIPTFQKKVMSNGKSLKCGNEFKIMCFDLPHDEENLGYLIYHIPSNRKILYITDCGSIDQYEFSDIDTFIIECNYDETPFKRLEKAFSERILTPEELNKLAKYRRLSGGFGHLSVQQTIEFLKKNINNITMNIILIHISKSEEDYMKYQRKVKRALPKRLNVVAINNNIPPSKIQTTNL